MGGREMKHLDKGIKWEGHLEALFKMYELVRTLHLESKLSDRIVGTSLGYMLSSSTCSWKVVGITPSALGEFRKQEFRNKPSGKPRVERGHFHHRRDVFGQLLSSNFSDSAQLLKYWRDHDETVLCLTNENAHVGSLRYFPIQQAIDIERPYFANAKTSYSFHPNYEGEYLKQLDAQVEANEVKLTTRLEQLGSGAVPR